VRVPLSWLRTFVPGLTASGSEIATALVRAGLEVEQVLRFGDDVSGVVVGRVLEIEELTGHKKPIRFCRVDVGGEVRDVVCGATNFGIGAHVPFALPGASLPGGFEIATRQTYGRTSDGMICSEAELGLSEASAGILLLPLDSPIGADVVELLELRDEVLDIAVTPDRGYTLSVRGVAREVATAFGTAFVDPGLLPVGPAAGGYEVRLEDEGCDRYVAAVVTGFDPEAASPPWLHRRLTLAGMRPISLAVDITNHVMLELGQPLHAFDLDTLQGPVVVRRARAGERLKTLDGQERALDAGDLLITDDRGPIALAGVMGGAETEIASSTRRILIESAHFEASTVTRTARRHRLPSEASKRFERGVDPALGPAAAGVAVRMLVELGGADAGPVTDADLRQPQAAVRLPLGLPGQVAGRSYAPEAVRARLADVGCRVETIRCS
jgi:phenylalanyl-tRNA synthetase beta chain